MLRDLPISEAFKMQTPDHAAQSVPVDNKITKNCSVPLLA